MVTATQLCVNMDQSDIRYISKGMTFIISKATQLCPNMDTCYIHYIRICIKVWYLYYP